ncbi:KWG Leptospira [Chryseobacterium taihuense]|uniref:KWG Leptospira n=2 Tax=Chryseobacterium group TaxID=2782232 RepID=A0A4U8WNF2_9FLAO|nr:KWG Leptospira [Chryseobacterium taihuense]
MILYLMKKILLFIFLLSLSFSLNLKSQELIAFNQDTLWGYKDKADNIIIKPQYQYAKKFIKDYAVVIKNDSTGVINKNNEIIIPFKYNFIQYLENDKFLFGYRTEYFGEFNMGVIDKDLKIIIPANFYYIEKYKTFYKATKNVYEILKAIDSGDLRSVKSLYGLFGLDGKEIIPCKYDQLSFLNDNLIVLEKNNLQALFNYRGEPITDFIYMVFGDFHDGLAKARIGNKYGFINELGKVVIPVKYDYCNEYVNGYSIVTLNNKWLALNTKGKIIITPKDSYDDVKKALETIR